MISQRETAKDALERINNVMEGVFVDSNKDPLYLPDVVANGEDDDSIVLVEWDPSERGYCITYMDEEGVRAGHYGVVYDVDRAAALGYGEGGRGATIINCTPHVVNIVTETTSVTLRPSGILPRVEMIHEEVAKIHFGNVPIPVFRTEAGGVTGLPESAEGTHFLVSRVVAEAARERTDLLIPDGAVRDQEGKIIGCRALARLGQVI